jgi:hypothetical protein
MNNKTTFVKEKDMAELICSLEGRVVVDEVIPLPFHPFYGRLQKGSDEESANTQTTPTLGGNDKPIN